MEPRSDEFDTNLLPDLGRVGRVGLLGMGSVGSGWAAVYLARGMEILAYDPGEDAADRTVKFLEDGWHSLVELGLTDRETPPLDLLRFVSIGEAVKTAHVIHENAPEHLEVKRQLLAEIERSAPAQTVICSSSGGLPPTEIQAAMKHPARMVVAHPFNPPHLIPLIEVVGGAKTSGAVIEWTMAFMTHMGKKPIRLDREKTAYLTNRLQFALLREAIHCLDSGVASARAIDDAIKYALAPRWAAMGGLMTLILAGGPGGIRHTLQQFSPAIESWWDDLGTPRLTADVKAKMISAELELMAGHSLTEWISLRDKKLVRLLGLIDDD